MLLSIADLGKGQALLQPFIERAASLSTLYAKHLEADKGDAHERLPGIHASELGCERRVYYTLKDAPKKANIPKKWKLRFEHGHAVHHMVQRQFKEMADATNGLMTFEKEVKVSAKHQAIAAELHLDSSADGVFTFFDRPQGEQVLRVGCEIKTESPDGYDDLKKPKPEHMQQVHLYMKALDLPLFWFFYFNKGNQNHTESYTPWLLVYNEAIWKEVEDKCRRLLKMAEQSVLPTSSESIWCEFCPYRAQEVCNPDYLAKKRTRAVNNLKTIRV